MERLTALINGRWCLQNSDDRTGALWPDSLLQKGIDRLAAYEDAEEQGLLVRMPCKAGDTVYELTKGLSIYKPGLHVCISEHTATELNIYDWARREDFGKTVFLTREEAEAALKGANRNG